MRFSLLHTIWLSFCNFILFTSSFSISPIDFSSFLFQSILFWLASANISFQKVYFRLKNDEIKRRTIDLHGFHNFDPITGCELKRKYFLANDPLTDSIYVHNDLERRWRRQQRKAYEVSFVLICHVFFSFALCCGPRCLRFGFFYHSHLLMVTVSEYAKPVLILHFANSMVVWRNDVAIIGIARCSLSIAVVLPEFSICGFYSYCFDCCHLMSSQHQPFIATTAPEQRDDMAIVVALINTDFIDVVFMRFEHSSLKPTVKLLLICSCCDRVRASFCAYYLNNSLCRWPSVCSRCHRH